MSENGGELIDFFISYTKSDEAWAEWIRERLKSSGCTALLQASDFLAGSNFVHDIDNALKQTKRTIAVLSEQYMKSPWCTAEWTAALSRDPLGREQKLTPVRIAECQPAGLLGPITYVDLVGLSPTEASQRLLGGLGIKATPLPPRPASEFYPGDFRQPWSVPHQENPNFMDRDDLVGCLHTK